MNNDRLNTDSLPRLWLPLLGLLCVAYTWRPLQAMDDVWQHAATGRWIVETHQIPRHTLLLWTARINWTDHSWLTDVVSYALLVCGGARVGPYVILGATCVAVTAIFVLIWRLWVERSRPTPLMPFLFALGIECSSYRFVPRPDLFTALGLTLLLAWLVQWSGPPPSQAPASRERVSQATASPRFWPIAIGIVILFAAWANFHGAVAVGVGILFASAMADIAQDRADHRSLGLLALAFLALASVCLTPYGWHYYSVWLIPKQLQFSLIDEWKPFWQSPRLGTDVVIEASLLTALAAVSWLLNPRRRWAHGLWLLLMAMAFLGARRYIWLLAIVCLVVMAANSDSIDTRKWWNAIRPHPMPQRWSTAMHGFICVALLLMIAASPFPWSLQPAAVSDDLPRGLVDFIAGRRIAGKVFNGDDYGSYLHWRFGDKLPLFIDDWNAFPDSLVIEYENMLGYTPVGRQLLYGGGIDFVVLRAPVGSETWPPLAVNLTADRRWALVYQGGDGAVWVRRIPRYEGIWKREEIK